MKRGGKMAVCLAALCCSVVARAVVNDGANPYQPIVDRNVFGLKDPPPPPTDPEPKGPPPPKITLTGITDVLGRKLALLEWQDPPVPGQPAKKTFSSLTEGQREGQVEVLEIDVKAGLVKVRNYGMVTNLTFETSGNKIPPTVYTPPPSLGGGIPSPTANIPPALPGVTPTSSITTIGTSAAPGAKAIPSRQLRLPPSAQPTATTTTTTTTTATTAAQPQLTDEEQLILMHVEKAVHSEAISKGKYPPPPPLPEPP